MRDIRGDLQDRANLLAEQISTAQGQFDRHIERHIEHIKREDEIRLEDLQSALDTVHMVIGFEGRGLGSSLSATKAQSKPSPPTHPRAEQARQPLPIR